MYQALERLAREFAAIEKIDQDAAALRLEDLMDAQRAYYCAVCNLSMFDGRHGCPFALDLILYGTRSLGKVPYPI